MFSWITGPRISNVSGELLSGLSHRRYATRNKKLMQEDPVFETTFIEEPDTPAPQFALKAFKQAIWGTPAPDDRSPSKKLEKRAKPDTTTSKSIDLQAPKDNAPISSPTKQPGGILMTPGTSRKGKSVSFGAHVVDNEGKKGGSRSGIPDNCPGKFPSPWTPGTELKLDATSDRPRSKLTEAFYNARSTPQLKAGEKPKAKDDSDITLELGAPRSESGKYWKEQYEAYAERSQKEMKKLVAKQQLAKNYAKKKDSEAIEAVTRLAEERKRFRNRERQLEQQNKDFQERLRQAMAEKTAASVEIAALKSRVAALEKGAATTEKAVEPRDSKMSFQIFEDLGKESGNSRPEQEKPIKARSTEHTVAPSIILGKAVRPSGFDPEAKENPSPTKRLRHTRRQTLPDASLRDINGGFTATSDDKSILAPQHSELPPRSPLSVRKPQPNNENLSPKSPTIQLPSSPFPMPSPDPWANIDNSPAPAMNSLSFPISTGTGASRPSRAIVPRHRASKAGLTTSKTEVRKFERHTTTSEPKGSDGLAERFAALGEKKTEMEKSTIQTEGMSTLAAKPAAAAEGHSHISRSRVGNALPVDRREEAKRRLMERKARKRAAAA